MIIMAIRTDLQITYKQSFRFQWTKKGCKANISTDLDEEEVLRTDSGHDQPSLSKHENEMHTKKTSLRKKTN